MKTILLALLILCSTGCTITTSWCIDTRPRVVTRTVYVEKQAPRRVVYRVRIKGRLNAR